MWFAQAASLFVDREKWRLIFHLNVPLIGKALTIFIGLDCVHGIKLCTHLCLLRNSFNRPAISRHFFLLQAIAGQWLHAYCVQI